MLIKMCDQATSWPYWLRRQRPSFLGL